MNNGELGVAIDSGGPRVIAGAVRGPAQSAAQTGGQT